MSRFLVLPWLKIRVFNIKELFWYIGRSPPPKQPLVMAPGTGTTSTPPPPKELFSTSAQASDAAFNVPPVLAPAIDKEDNPFWALVIGIDKYTNVTPLNGCAADADDVADYLEKTLGVSPTHITNLRNGNATRRAIKESISGLASNKDIKDGNPIVIFFAGHGAQAKAPPGWAAGGQHARIQMILPVDFVGSTNNNEDWQGIPDITLAALLSNLAKAKGDNITVIHDCCHSGSSTRNSAVSRRIELPDDYEVLESIDRDVDGGHRVSSVSTGFQKTAMGSHVLLAACSEAMLAQESPDDNGQKRGNFTRTLLEFLRSPIVQGAAITYTELISRLPDLPGAQYPQCDGDNRSRIMFDGKAPKKSKVLYHVTVNHKLGATLQAGEAQGITKNAIVSIFSSSNMTVPVGQLQVAKTGACSSSLQKIPGERPFEIPPSAWATLTKAGDGVDISVAVPLEDSFLLLFLKIVQEMEVQRPEKRNILAVDSNPALKLKYELALATENSQVTFQIGDSECRKEGLTRIPYTTKLPLTQSDADGLYTVLAYAADFFFHLSRSNNNGKNALAGRLKLEAHTLEEKFLGADPDRFSRDPVLMPSSPNLVADDRKLYAEAGDEYDNIDTKYGFRLVNNSERNLYVWAFMFDMSSLAIRCIYRPAAAKMKANSSNLNTHAGAGVAADASLLAKGELTIGYGSGGARPQSFGLESSQMVDVSYLKLFVTTRYVDLSYLEQASPFLGPGGRVAHDAATRDVWDTVKLMIVQKRPTAS
ncbi:hypothetical protein MVEN_01438000 [Mycena venus]|uniref:Peptidase C14 caspase domain-containing protein n=1 Tax=Mycena venus TaxID=2733690 RepID=A0A8H6XXW0_9AGAR|nr:hypothetical protein MVEN_01438000 [Mycena venus]